MRLTVAAETPTSAAICWPVWRCRRKDSTAEQMAGVAWLGDESGLEDRSRKPSTPSAANRAIHLAAVFGVVLNHRADHHLSTFRRQRRIPVRVHSVLCESLTFGDISVHGPNRMDNLLKGHS